MTESVQSPAQPKSPEGLLERYRVELLHRAPPDLTSTALLEHLQRSLREIAADDAQPTVERTAGEALEIRSVVRTGDAGDPPSWTLEPASRNEAALESSLGQSWWWSTARDALAEAKAVTALSDRSFLTLDHRRRLSAFQRVLAAAIRTTRPLAIHWLPSGQLLDPMEVAAATREDGFTSPLPGGLNVRFYQLDPADRTTGDQEMVMDTLGLGAIGLIDLQCHFRGLDPEDVSRVLYTIGCYLFDHGLVIREGDSVQGPLPADRWVVHETEALAPPARAVLDLDAGFPFSVRPTPGDA